MVTPIAEALTWQGITITRTQCQHESNNILVEMGEASGFVLQAETEPTVFWAGDTIWNGSVAEVIDRIQPDVIITHSCGAVWGDNVLIVMDAAQTVAVCRAAPESIVIATHMNSLDHATVSRDELRHYAADQKDPTRKTLDPSGWGDTCF